MSQYLDWKVGDRVVCVNPGAVITRPGVNPRGLVEGRVYTIRWIGVHDYHFGAGEHLSVRLCEYVRDDEDCPVGAVRFRKVQPRATDISIFTAMLHSPKTPVQA